MKPALSSDVYAGADGCPAGWVVVSATCDGARLALRDVRVELDFVALLQTTSACAALAVDIPIGLSEDGRREADFLARACIGPRRSSVFPAPPRFALDVPDYATANALSRSRFSHGLQKQTFNIVPKIKEADACLTPAMQQRVVESHPEVSFWALAGRNPLRYAKRSPEGRALRLRLLQTAFGPAMRDLKPPYGAAWDDLYDACVLAWTASRVADGTAVHLPSQPQRDARGLRMEMVY